MCSFLNGIDLTDSSCSCFNGHFASESGFAAFFHPLTPDVNISSKWQTFFTGQMRFLAPNQQCHSTEGNNYVTDHGKKFGVLKPNSITLASSEVA